MIKVTSICNIIVYGATNWTGNVKVTLFNLNGFAFATIYSFDESAQPYTLLTSSILSDSIEKFKKYNADVMVPKVSGLSIPIRYIQFNATDSCIKRGIAFQEVQVFDERGFLISDILTI